MWNSLWASPLVIVLVGLGMLLVRRRRGARERSVLPPIPGKCPGRFILTGGGRGPGGGSISSHIDQLELELDVVLEEADRPTREGLERLLMALRVQEAWLEAPERLLRHGKSSGGPGEVGTREEAARAHLEVDYEEERAREGCRVRRDLLATLDWIRILVASLHLARRTGAPPSREADLLRQIVRSVEGLSWWTSWARTSPPCVDLDSGSGSISDPGRRSSGP